jgi:sirohydrochlorin cobaltochelatase
VKRGLLLVGHGSHLSPHSSAPIHAHARALREQGTFDEVRVGFWKEEPSISRAVDGFDSADVTVVPVFNYAG